MANVTLHGNPFNTVGELPAVGGAAPDFTLTMGYHLMAMMIGERR